MTLDEASKIVVIWGKYVEFMYAKFVIVFGNHIPESLLPFPKITLSEALNVVAEHHRSIGNNDGVKTLESVAEFLNAFVDDEAALLQAANKFSDPNWRITVIPSLKKIQDAWIKAQKI